jgi:Skp family chaperone for outer membrane proteins
MKTMLQKGFVIAVAMVLGAFSAGAQGAPGNFKIGVVDLKKVFEGYYKKTLTDNAFKTEAEDLDRERKGMVEDARKVEERYRGLLDSANDMAVSKEERDKAKAAAEEKYRDLVNRKDALEQYDRQAMAKLDEQKREKRDVLVGEIKDHLVAKAKAGGYNLVLDSSGESANLLPVALYVNNVPDLTDELLKELNAGAPASFVPGAKASSTNK